MQAIVLAAGMGKRIQHLTDDKPKSLLKIKDNTIIGHILDKLSASSLVTEIIVVTGYRADSIRQAAGDYEKVRFVHNPFFECCNVLGSFWVGARYLKEDFVFAHADTIFEQSILDDLLAARAQANMVVDFGAVDDEAMKVETDGERGLKAISKTIPVESSAGEFIGLALFTGNAVQMIKAAAEQLLEEGYLNEYFEATIDRLVQEGTIETSTLIPVNNRFWREIDFAEDYDAAVEHFR